jgi:chorismate dehydratase
MEDKKIKISAVSYLNTKPFLYGIFKHEISKKIDLELNIPSVCAQKLQNGEADLALVPVAIIPHLENPTIISDYCIGTDGKVRTVCLFGETPIQKWKKVYLDFHSRSSVELTKFLMKDYFKIQPEYLPATEGFIDQIKGTTGGLVIGDRTFPLHWKFQYIYDLGEIWQQHTGLPFVFAAWVTRKKLDPEFLSAFNEALALGLDYIPELICLMPDDYEIADLGQYFNQNIKYKWTPKKKQALEFFLKKLDYEKTLHFE